MAGECPDSWMPLVAAIWQPIVAALAVAAMTLRLEINLGPSAKADPTGDEGLQ